MKYTNTVTSIGRGNKISFSTDSKGNPFDENEIIESWKRSYIEKIAHNDNEIGLRMPQYGALSAIRAHWVVSSSPATIVLPTGTGKTEAMFATIASQQIKKTLIIVPSNLLREQIFEGAKTFGILPEIGLLSDEVVFPTVLLYKSSVNDQNSNKINEAFESANIIISTPLLINNLPTKTLEKLIKNVDVVMFDEAHHLAAQYWKKVKELFIGKRILQFTATPFRNDGKKLGGKIIFNYGLELAQKEGYFKPIDFHPIQEFNEQESDKKVAQRAIDLLEVDLEEGHEHTVLVRASTKKRANELYDNIYSKFIKYNPVVIHSDIPNAEKKLLLKQVKSGYSKIIVCVDMFGEGIDIPTLKIAAVHDKYKSLPITLQFIGRFARTSSKNLGNAKMVTNIALDELKESIEELYHQDSDWNQLLNIHSTDAINNEIMQDEFYRNFEKGHISKIDLSQLKMKISTRIFKSSSNDIDINRWNNVLNSDRTTTLFNNEENIYIFIEEVEKQVSWSDQKNIVHYEYEFFVIFFDTEKGLIHINETDVRKGNRLIENIFYDPILIKGEQIYRCLDGINRLMISTLGLKQTPSGRISFRMFAGTDTKAGINEAVVSSSIKSNLFGYGYRGGQKISIGCSYKGKIWMRWVEQIDFWREWCVNIGEIILDNTIDTNHILENSLTMNVIKEFPGGVPYKMILPEQIEVSNTITKKIHIPKEEKLYPFFQSDLRKPKIVNGNLQFELWVNTRKFTFEQTIVNNSFVFRQLSGQDIHVRQNNTNVEMSVFLKENPPEVSFINSNGNIIIVEGNFEIIIKPKKDLKLSSINLFPINWEKMGVDIKVESQGLTKKKNSIQYATIHNIIDQKSDIIFDDDGSGEIADIVAIKVDEEKREILINLYHCKYSSSKKPGGRVSDLYEVSGQAEKSIMWNDNCVELIKRMIEREKTHQKNYESTRIEKGDIKILHMVKQMITSGFKTEIEISIVQPGVSIGKITPSMKQILLATDSYLKDTYEIPLSCYFSK